MKKKIKDIKDIFLDFSILSCFWHFELHIYTKTNITLSKNDMSKNLSPTLANLISSLYRTRKLKHLSTEYDLKNSHFSEHSIETNYTR